MTKTSPHRSPGKKAALTRKRRAAAGQAAQTKKRSAWAAKGRPGWPEVVSNADLRLFHVPPPGADVHKILHFALTYEGYSEAGTDSCGDIANARRNVTLHDLRTCLFFEQRRAHHFGEPPTGEALEYVRGLVEKIRAKLKASGRGRGMGKSVHRIDPEVHKRASDFAARAHGDQKVPGSGFPYVVHVSKVAMEVLAATEDEPELDRDFAVACALLHDTVEDSEPEDRRDVVARLHTDFGKAVAEGVLALTKDDAIELKSARMADSLARIRRQPREVWVVKLADRITNLEPPPPDWDAAKIGAYLEEARQILKALGSANARLRARFEEKLAEYGKHVASADGGERTQR
jgi:hypothetical protein